MNVLGALFSHGPKRGEFHHLARAALPASHAKTPRKSLVERAEDHGLSGEEVGVINSEVLVDFIWSVAGRPPEADGDWRRERPLIVVMDNYSVHKSERVGRELPAFTAAGIEIFYLPPYSPELSQIEPIWQDVKYRQMVVRSHEILGNLKRAVEQALLHKALRLRQTDQLLHVAA